MDTVEKNRLQWKCRRGLLELDLVLQKYLLKIKEQDAKALNQLLDLPDNDLWDIVIGRSERYAPHLGAIAAQLRAL
jgi:antitoxin CptB